jgi:hypothetical protein
MEQTLAQRLTEFIKELKKFRKRQNILKIFIDSGTLVKEIFESETCFPHHYERTLIGNKLKMVKDHAFLNRNDDFYRNFMQYCSSNMMNSVSPRCSRIPDIIRSVVNSTTTDFETSENERAESIPEVTVRSTTTTTTTTTNTTVVMPRDEIPYDNSMIDLTDDQAFALAVQNSLQTKESEDTKNFENRKRKLEKEKKVEKGEEKEKKKKYRWKTSLNESAVELIHIGMLHVKNHEGCIICFEKVKSIDDLIVITPCCYKMICDQCMTQYQQSFYGGCQCPACKKPLSAVKKLE